MRMKLESWLKHHSASKSKFNLEILHTLKDLHIAGLFFLSGQIFFCLLCLDINHYLNIELQGSTFLKERKIPDLIFHEVSKDVNKPTNNSASLVQTV